MAFKLDYCDLQRRIPNFTVSELGGLIHLILTMDERIPTAARTDPPDKNNPYYARIEAIDAFIHRYELFRERFNVLSVPELTSHKIAQDQKLNDAIQASVDHLSIQIIYEKVQLFNGYLALKSVARELPCFAELRQQPKLLTSIWELIDPEDLSLQV